MINGKDRYSEVQECKDSRYLVRNSEVFIKNKTQVASRMVGNWYGC